MRGSRRVATTHRGPSGATIGFGLLALFAVLAVYHLVVVPPLLRAITSLAGGDAQRALVVSWLAVGVPVWSLVLGRWVTALIPATGRWLAARHPGGVALVWSVTWLVPFAYITGGRSGHEHGRAVVRRAVGDLAPEVLAGSSAGLFGLAGLAVGGPLAAATMRRMLRRLEDGHADPARETRGEPASPSSRATRIATTVASLVLLVPPVTALGVVLLVHR